MSRRLLGGIVVGITLGGCGLFEDCPPSGPQRGERSAIIEGAAPTTLKIGRARVVVEVSDAEGRRWRLTYQDPALP